MLPYYASEEGRAVYEEHRATVRASCPQYEDEIRGISDGSEIAFEKVCPQIIASAEMSSLW